MVMKRLMTIWLALSLPLGSMSLLKPGSMPIICTAHTTQCSSACIQARDSGARGASTAAECSYQIWLRGKQPSYATALHTHMRVFLVPVHAPHHHRRALMCWCAVHKTPSRQGPSEWMEWYPKICCSARRAGCTLYRKTIMCPVKSHVLGSWVPAPARSQTCHAARAS